MDRQQRLDFILSHADNSRYRGRLPDANLILPGGRGECGESVTLYLRVDGDRRIAAATFEAEGTTLGRAAASITTGTLLGKTLAEVIEMPHDSIVDALGHDLAADRFGAVTVALDTAKAAARKYLALETGADGAHTPGGA